MFYVSLIYVSLTHSSCRSYHETCILRFLTVNKLLPFALQADNILAHDYIEQTIVRYLFHPTISWFILTNNYL